MLPRRIRALSRTYSRHRRSFASASSPIHSLLYVEHRSGDIDAGSLSALTAASQLGGKVTGLVVGRPGDVDSIVEKVKNLEGITGVLHSSSEAYTNNLAETITLLLASILERSEYTHVVSSHSSNSKNIIPRLSGVLDIPAVSDVMSVSHSPSDNTTTFTRPIYAGNAIATIKAPASLHTKIFTVRSTAFAKAPSSPHSSAKPSDVPTTHLETIIAKSDRPELGTAARVVSGGRALKNAVTFKETLNPLADALGAAVGASRAAVDAGYADNSLQVGQTGKVVAPELYVAIGISGAIQHLAGMKDSKLIVAINKDADAPIFQVADVGLVADLYEAVPELVKKLQK
ncbi:hypothetical protein BS47DRAFT_1353281 [Hydnum rufescens UP504]|uniref:Probable electron transfer flavoprotein subunit alpha n=1 Tax=Hydnum rufescens UP504 TaxID=1448309 RepID=A0A9P6DP98_9AGAM|nr:hypothetical protein BS47DRAFT_1353281 [Hydnum rufescens UP504]